MLCLKLLGAETVSASLCPPGLAQALPIGGAQLVSVGIIFEHLSGLQSTMQAFFSAKFSNIHKVERNSIPITHIQHYQDLPFLLYLPVFLFLMYIKATPRHHVISLLYQVHTLKNKDLKLHCHYHI